MEPFAAKDASQGRQTEPLPGELGGAAFYDTHGDRRSSVEEQQAILSGYSYEDQQTLLRRLDVLSVLAYHLGRDFKMPVLLNKPGQGWHWNFVQNEVRVDPEDLLKKPQDVCRFIMCHEGAHRRISRITSSAQAHWQEPGYAFLSNCIEDPRVNNYARHALPSIGEKMGAAYQNVLFVEQPDKKSFQDKLGFKPKSLECGLEYIRAWLEEFKGGEPATVSRLPKESEKVLAATLSAAAKAWHYYPTRQEADRGEKVIAKYAEATNAIIAQEVWPHFKLLVEKDLKNFRLQSWFKGKGKNSDEPASGSGMEIPKDLDKNLTKEERKELKKHIENSEKQHGQKPCPVDELSPELRQKLEDYLDSLPEDQRKDLENAARNAYKECEDELNEKLRGKLNKREADKSSDVVADTPMSQGTKSNRSDLAARAGEKFDSILQRDLTEYDRIVVQDRDIVARLETRLKTELRQRLESGYIGGFTSGQRINIQSRISELARGQRGLSRAWEQRNEEIEFDYAFLLLADLSDSMGGAPVHNAFRGLTVTGESLRRVNIPVAIYGFNHQMYEFKKFSDPFSREIKEKIGGITQSTGSCTDLGWAIDQASLTLESQRAKNKILIVLTDGEPYPSSAHRESEFEVQNVLARLKERDGQRIVALGLGLERARLERHFGRDVPLVADISPEALPSALARVVERTVINDRFGGASRGKV